MNKKFLIITGLIIIGIILYLASVYSILRNDAEFTIVLPVFLLVHIVLSILYSLKDYSKKLLIVMVVLFLINLFINQIQFPTCETGNLRGLESGCNCLGIKKSSGALGMSSQCIGIRTTCYNYIDYGKTKLDIPCN
jgi:hypothetical protein